MRTEQPSTDLMCLWSRVSLCCANPMRLWRSRAILCQLLAAAPRVARMVRQAPPPCYLPKAHGLRIFSSQIVGLRAYAPLERVDWAPLADRLLDRQAYSPLERQGAPHLQKDSLNNELMRLWSSEGASLQLTSLTGNESMRLWSRARGTTGRGVQSGSRAKRLEAPHERPGALLERLETRHENPEGNATRKKRAPPKAGGTLSVAT